MCQSGEHDIEFSANPDNVMYQCDVTISSNIHFIEDHCLLLIWYYNRAEAFLGMNPRNDRS